MLSLLCVSPRYSEELQGSPLCDYPETLGFKLSSSPGRWPGGEITPVGWCGISLTEPHELRDVLAC